MSSFNDVTDENHLALPKGTMLFEYRIESVLGQGGFGITYLALDTLLDESVALKEYFPNETAVRTSDLSARAKSKQDQEAFRGGLDAFLEEARIVARFRHPNIMQVRRFFEAHGTGYIVLQFERGRSFEDVVARGPMPEADILPILSGILDGLSIVHERAILHRDLKPRNIIIRDDGSPVLIDFGAARDFAARNSRSVTKIASAGYSPPEQYGVGNQQGPWTDFYALGAMLYRAVTGRLPPDSLRRLRDDPFIPAVKAAGPPYSSALLRAIDRMLQLDEQKRPASALEIRKLVPALERPQATVKVQTISSGADKFFSPAENRARPPRLGGRVVWLGMGTLVIVILSFSAYFLRSPGWVFSQSDLVAEKTNEKAQPVVPPSEPTSQSGPELPKGSSNQPSVPPPILPPSESARPVDGLANPSPSAPAEANEELKKRAEQSAQAQFLACIQFDPCHARDCVDAYGQQSDSPAALADMQRRAAAAVCTSTVDEPATAPRKSGSLTPGEFFRDCPTCPELAVIPSGSFEMGSNSGFPFEKPPHRVLISNAFAIGRRETTFAEWDACVAAGGCKYQPGDQGWGRGNRPVIDVSWADAQAYLAWLSVTTGARYRMPTEAEWEYADRAGTTGDYWWGPDVGKGHANCSDCLTEPVRSTEPAGSFPANSFGLFDMAGNVAEWVEDCWSGSYEGAPVDGSAVLTGDCGQRVLRGGSFMNDARYLRSAARFKYDAAVRYYANGFRVARDLP